MNILHIGQNGVLPAEIDNALSALQRAVGGHIEVIHLTDKLAVICNEEGKLLGLPVTAALSNNNGKLTDMLCGDLVVCRTTPDGEFADIQPQDYPALRLYLTVLRHGTCYAAP